ncbi:MAG: ribbon-helix-helix domain-containing protein [Candidatus Omnitrophota bacterium]
MFNDGIIDFYAIIMYNRCGGGNMSAPRRSGNMERMQVQLMPFQTKKLKEISKEMDASVSELIRKGVDLVIEKGIDWEGKRQKAMEAVGRFSSGRKDVSEEHDQYLTEDIS